MIVNTPNNPDKLNLVLEGFYTADRNFTLPTFAPLSLLRKFSEVTK